MAQSWGGRLAGGGGVDIQPMCDRGVPCAGLTVSGEFREDKTDSYFRYHHTQADSITHLRREEVNKCVARYDRRRAWIGQLLLDSNDC